MIKIKLKEICLKLGKNISDIAKDTGINRNTVASFYYNRVDGVKFETVEKICNAYDLELEDLLEMKKEKENKREQVLYKQLGDYTLFGLCTTLISFDGFKKEFMPLDFGSVKFFFNNKGEGAFYADAVKMNEMASYMSKTYNDEDRYMEVFNDYLKYVGPVEQLYFKNDFKDISLMDEQDLRKFFFDFKEKYQKFWQSNVFITSIDAGFDQFEIARIAKIYNFNTEEIAVLTATDKLMFNQERVLEVLRIVRAIKDKKIPLTDLDEYLESSAEVKKYIKNFNYYLLRYDDPKFIEISDLKKEVIRYLNDELLFRKEYKWLRNYDADIIKKKKKILLKRKIKDNPLALFARLSYWREHRKRTNLMGVFLLFAVLQSMERITGIPLGLLSHSIFDEFDNILKGLISADVLRERAKEGYMILIENGGYKMILGQEASSLANDLDEQILGEVSEKFIEGIFVSRGYAKGLVRLLTSDYNLEKFKDGDVAVIENLNNKILPSLKRATAIIAKSKDDDGLIAKFAREFGKPCLVGVKNIFNIVHDGDLVEVRANHGTARILNKN